MSALTTRSKLGLTTLVAAVAVTGGCNLVLGITDLTEGSGGGGGGATSSSTHASTGTRATTTTSSTGAHAGGGSSTGAQASGGGGSSTGTLGGGGGGVGGGGSTGTLGGGGGGAPPCTDNTSCPPTPGGVCLGGVCHQPSCNAAPVLDIFAAADIGTDKLDTDHVIVLGNNKAAAVAVTDLSANELLIRVVHSDGHLDPIAKFDFAGKNGKFTDGFWGPTTLTIQGTYGDDIGEIQFTLDGNGDPQNPKFVPFDSPGYCHSPGGSYTRAVFAHTQAATKYAATCDGSKRALILGGFDELNTVLWTGMATDASLNVLGYALTGQPMRLLFTGGQDSGTAFWRAGAAPTDLANAGSPFLVSTDATRMVNLDLLAPLPTDDGFVISAGDYSSMLQANYWSGAVQDPTKLSEIPPPGIELRASFTALQTQTRFGGDSSPARTGVNGVYAAARPFNFLTANITWLTPTGEMLLIGSPVYTETVAMTSITTAAAAPAGLSVFVGWAEQLNSFVTVRGTFALCAE